MLQVTTKLPDSVLAAEARVERASDLCASGRAPQGEARRRVRGVTNHVRKAIMILSAVCALFILFGSSFVAGGAENPTDQPTNMKSLAIESILIGGYGRELCDIIQPEMLSLGPDDVLVETYGLEGGQSGKRTARDSELWNAIRTLEAGGLTQKYVIEDGQLVSFTILAEPDRYRVVTIHDAARIDNLPQVIKRHSRE